MLVGRSSTVSSSSSGDETSPAAHLVPRPKKARTEAFEHEEHDFSREDHHRGREEEEEGRQHGGRDAEQEGEEEEALENWVEAAGPQLRHSIQLPKARVMTFTDASAAAGGHGGYGHLLISAALPGSPTQQQQAIALTRLDRLEGGPRPLAVHDGAIRDIKPCPGKDLVASCGFDKQLRLSSLSEGKEVLRASLPANGWTVCWQALDQNVLHCALDNGSILTLDVRRMGDEAIVQTRRLPCQRPVWSLAHCYDHKGIGTGMLLLAGPSGLYAWGDLMPMPLDLNLLAPATSPALGTCVSVSLTNAPPALDGDEMPFALASFRQTGSMPATHCLFDLHYWDTFTGTDAQPPALGPGCGVVATHQGHKSGAMMSRSAAWMHGETSPSQQADRANVLLASGDVETNRVVIWSTPAVQAGMQGPSRRKEWQLNVDNTSVWYYLPPHPDPVLDVCFGSQASPLPCFASLSASEVRIYTL